MYLIGLQQQLRNFSLSLGVGFLLGIIYDLFRLTRVVLFKRQSKAVIITQDVIYALTCGFVTFLFLLSKNYGEFRAYVIAGEGIGFLIYFFTLGIVAVRFVDTVTNKMRKALNVILKPLKSLICQVNMVKRNLNEKTVNKSKKFLKNFKIRLQPRGVLLYNLNEKFCLYSSKRKKMMESETEED